MTATSTATVPAQRRTRKPTGKPPWPILLIAGGEKAGKSWSCAEASGSDLVGRTLWIGIGEDDPDEYGNIPGADFEIVEHDGTYRDILTAITWAVAQPLTDGKPNLIVVDSMTKLWELLCDIAQVSATDRAIAKARKQNRPVPENADEADIHMDLWNIAKGRWANVLDALREHQGPVVLTARLEEVTVMVNGVPARDGSKTWKVKAEKSLPYDVGGIVQMPERGKAYLTGVRTTRIKVPERLVLPGFTVDKLWRDLGLADVETGERHHQGVQVHDGPAAVVQAIRSKEEADAAAAAVAVATVSCADVEKIRATWQEANTRGLIGIDVGTAVTMDQAAVVGVTGTSPLTLGDWLKAVGTWAAANGGLSVADQLALIDTPDTKADPEKVA